MNIIYPSSTALSTLKRTKNIFVMPEFSLPFLRVRYWNIVLSNSSVHHIYYWLALIVTVGLPNSCNYIRAICPDVTKWPAWTLKQLTCFVLLIMTLHWAALREVRLWGMRAIKKCSISNNLINFFIHMLVNLNVINERHLSINLFLFLENATF